MRIESPDEMWRPIAEERRTSRVRRGEDLLQRVLGSIVNGTPLAADNVLRGVESSGA